MSKPRLIASVTAAILSLSIAYAIPAHAQLEDEQTDLDTIEAELDGKKADEASPGTAEKAKEEFSTPEPELKEPEKLSDLGRLQPFSEVSVIQRRFLPKTERFQFFLGFAAIANDPWFYGVGAAARFGYSFTESLALELNVAGLSTSEKDAVKDLRTNNNVRTDSIISANNYLGLDAVWSPIYGKMSLFNRRIVPFDMYFAAGAGQTGLTNARTSSATSFHVGTGQIFAMSKGIGFRWDLSWNFYNATPNPAPGSTGAAPGESQFNNLLLTLGASFFFPEANYR